MNFAFGVLGGREEDSGLPGAARLGLRTELHLGAVWDRHVADSLTCPLFIFCLFCVQEVYDLSEDQLDLLIAHWRTKGYFRGSENATSIELKREIVLYVRDKVKMRYV